MDTVFLIGHVYVTVNLREGAPAVWTLQAELVLEAGRLSQLAARASAFEAAVISNK